MTSILNLILNEKQKKRKKLSFVKFVKCFSCNGALRDWKPNDDPWNQHAFLFSRCRYLISKKEEVTYRK